MPWSKGPVFGQRCSRPAASARAQLPFARVVPNATFVQPVARGGRWVVRGICKPQMIAVDCDRPLRANVWTEKKPIKNPFLKKFPSFAAPIFALGRREIPQCGYCPYPGKPPILRQAGECAAKFPKYFPHRQQQKPQYFRISAKLNQCFAWHSPCFLAKHTMQSSCPTDLPIVEAARCKTGLFEFRRLHLTLKT